MADKSEAPSSLAGAALHVGQANGNGPGSAAIDGGMDLGLPCAGTAAAVGAYETGLHQGYLPLVAARRPTASTPQAPAPTATTTVTAVSRRDGAVRLTTPPTGASDQNPAYAPDGRCIVFTRFEKGYNVGPAGLFLLDIESTQTTRLTPWEDQDNVNLPGSAWDGVHNRIVFASDRAEADDLWRIAPDGSDFSRITRHSGPPWYIEPSWSPDGRWIVFEADAGVPDDRQQGSIWTVRANGADLTTLTDGPGGGVDDRQPNWSPAGDRILFQRRAPGSDDWNLYTMAPDGGDIRGVATAPASDTDASWSPDGRWIVYSSDYGGLPTPNIFVVPALGGAPIRVTSDATHEDGAPSWSPDGRWIVFESHRGQNEDTPASLWRIPVPSSLALTRHGRARTARITDALCAAENHPLRR